MDRCAKCPGINKLVPPDGPEHSPILFIGEAPGAQENKAGRPFVGKTGKEVDGHYLPQAGLRRPECRFTNAIKCLKGSTRVVLPSGSTDYISHLYATKYRGLVPSYNELTGEMELVKVQTIHKNPRYGRPLLRIRPHTYRHRGGRGEGGSVVTSDHLILTQRGWIEAAKLSSSDYICTGAPGLSLRQWEFLVGTLLGDSQIARSSLMFGHGIKQIEWLECKIKLFSNLRMTKPKLRGDGKAYTAFSKNQPVLRGISRKSLLSLGRGLSFSYISFAALYMDDGYAHTYNNGKLKQMEVCCTGLSDSQRANLTYLISEALSLDAYNRHGRIFLRAEDSRLVASLIAPYVPPTMRYKLGGYDCPEFDPALYTADNEVFWDRVVIDKVSARNLSVYCIEVERNDNFLTIGGVVHNCLPVSTGGKLDPKSPKDLALLESCAMQHLYPEIEEAKPELVVPMGSFACKAIDPDIDLDIHHGIPRETAWGKAFPMFHPALGIHEPKKMLQIRTDWYRLKKYLNGNLAVPQDEYPNPDYREFETVQEMRDYLDSTIPMAQDTESKRGHIPYCLTLSQYPGTGRLIRAERKDLIAELQTYLDRWESSLLFHYLMADYDPMESMGLQYPPNKIRDTIALAFQLGNLPQGLKALAFRELGMVMQDFDDLVTPYSTPLVLSYYHQAYMQEWPKPQEELIRDDKGEWKLYRPQRIETKLKRFFTDFENNPAKDVFKAWENWEMHWEVIESRLGMWPGKCISYVPYPMMLYYACRDADATLRLASVLDRMRKRVRRVPQERWGDNG